MNRKYKKNLDALYAVNEAMMDTVQQGELPEWLDLSGDNATVTKRGRVIGMYPESFVKEIDDIANHDIFHSDTATVIVGMGLGRLAHKVLSNMRKGHRVIVVEPIPGMIQAAMERLDFSQWIKTTELAFATNKVEVASMVSALDGAIVVQGWLNLVEQYVLFCEEYNEIMKYTTDILDQHRCGVGTVMGAGPVIAENDIKNLPYILLDRGVKDLKDMFQGKTAVSIATGPSLAKNIHLLMERKDDVVIIAVAQALRLLLAYGIRPDFITTVDYGIVNFEHFSGLLHHGIPLVALNRANDRILKYYRGPRFIVGTEVPGYEETSHGLIKDKGTLEQGGSVVHLSYQLAKHLGCKKVILLGHNLSYENGLSHVQQVDAGGEVDLDPVKGITWKIQDPRSSLSGQEHNYGQVVYVPGFFGDPIPTNVGLSSFITTFESFFESDKDIIEVYNATEGGARLIGAKSITLEAILETVPRGTIDKENRNESLITKDPEGSLLVEEALKRLQVEHSAFDKIIEASLNGIRCADKMIEAGRNKRQYRRWAELNDRYATEAHELSIASLLMGLHIYATSRKIYSKELKVSGKESHLLRDLEDRQTRVNRSKLILQAAHDAAQRLKPMYEEAIEILQRYLRGDIDILSPVLYEPLDISDVHQYLDAGNWSHPFVDALRGVEQGNGEWKEWMEKLEIRRWSAIEIAKSESAKERRQDLLDYNDHIELSREAGKLKDYETSLLQLEKAADLFPEKFPARWGLASACALVGQTERSLTIYELLERDFPDNHRVCFEHGLVILHKDLDAGIAKIEQAMSKSPEYIHFFYTLGILYEQKKDLDRARECYEVYGKAFPDDPRTAKKLSELAVVPGA